MKAKNNKQLEDFYVMFLYNHTLTMDGYHGVLF